MGKLEKIANVSVILASLLLVFTVTRTYWPGQTPDSGADLQARVGQPINLPGVPTSGSQASLVLAITEECPYCIANLPFYRRLAAFRSSAPGALRLVAVLPSQPESTARFLQVHEIDVDATVSEPLDKIGVQVTPTLLLLDRNVKLTQSWVGFLDAAKQEEVLKVLKEVCPSCAVPTAAASLTPIDPPSLVPALVSSGSNPIPLSGETR